MVDGHVSASQRKTFTGGLNAEIKNTMLTAVRYLTLKLVDDALRQNRIAADTALPAVNTKLST